MKDLHQARTSLLAEPIALLDLRRTYPEPPNDLEAIQKIKSLIETELHTKLTNEQITGIIEYYNLIQHKKEPAYYWFLEAIMITARRDATKRNPAYMIGILKKWISQGYGATPTKEEQQLIALFEEATGIPVTDAAVTKLRQYIYQHGLVMAAKQILQLQHTDLAALLMDHLTSSACSTNGPLAGPISTVTGDSPAETEEVREAENDDVYEEQEQTNAAPAENALAMYTLDRKLRGGVARNHHFDELFIPESIIRQKNMQHGDKLKLLGVIHKGARLTHSHFETVEKVGKAHPLRKQYSYCLVARDDLMWYVDSHMPEYESDNRTVKSLYIDEMPLRLKLRDEDVRDFALNRGDLIDVAFWGTDTTTLKVCWKHHV